MVDMKSKSTIFSLLVLIVAIIGIAGIFMTWTENWSFLATDITGWDYISNLSEDKGWFYEGGYFEWMPLLVLIFAVVGFLGGLIGVTKPGKVGGSAAILSGIIICIATLAFILSSFTVIFEFKMSDYLGTGVYLAVISGVLMIIFGALMSNTKTTK